MDPSIEACVHLVERIRLSDAIAEDELVEAYHRQVFAMAMARTHDGDASRDLVQDILWAVVQSLRNGQLREPAKLSAFVSGTARNVIATFVRHRISDRTIPLSEALTLAAGFPSDENPERIARVEQALAGLSADDRQILVLTLLEGLKSGEIARRLELSSDVVRQRKTRAIRRVAAILGGQPPR